jgi:F0F1-type ATP synthase membrane subunit a
VPIALRTERFQQIWQAVKEFVYGMTAYDFEQEARRMRAELETLFLLIVFGDMIGLPILPSYYSLRLLPYVVPVIERWKRQVLRERDITELEELHLIEM